jgi:flagellar basal-body rod protein FlgG
MLTQTRKLTSISNNIANVNTTGYKKEQVTTTTFGSMVINRLDSQQTELGSVTLMSIADTLNTIHSQGTLKETERTLDFAIRGEGLFAIQGEGGVMYTRNGSFDVDNEGFLTCGDLGRVMGQNGPIQIGTDGFTADESGNLYVNGAFVDKIAVYNFEEYNALKNAADGLFTSVGGQGTLMDTASVLWKTLEGSNVDAAEEMTNAISTQRQIQACSQAIKMYDEIVSGAVTQIGKV